MGAQDFLPQIIWTGEFLLEQGFDIKETILYQDNLSSILLEKNGQSSSSKRTRHMNIRYFFIKDRVEESRELTIEHCPTEEMVADFFTKPLQGNLFYRFRDDIMGIGPDSEYHSSGRSVLSNEDEQDGTRMMVIGIRREDPEATDI